MNWSEVKPVAKALFGRPARLLLAAWILGRQGQAFFTLEAQIALAQHGEAHSAVTRELEVLVAAGLLSRIDSPHRIYFQPVPHGLWPAFERIARHFDLFELLQCDPGRSAVRPERDGPAGP